MAIVPTLTLRQDAAHCEIHGARLPQTRQRAAATLREECLIAVPRKSTVACLALALTGCVGLAGSLPIGGAPDALSIILPDGSGANGDTTELADGRVTDSASLDAKPGRDVKSGRPHLDASSDTVTDAGLPEGCTKSTECAYLNEPTGCLGNHYCDVATGKCLQAAALLDACTESWASLQAAHPCEVPGCVGPPAKCAWQPVADGTPCDDANKCTSDEACQGGSCKPGTWDKTLCECLKDTDCAAYNSTDKCQVVWFCNKALTKCQPNPSTGTTCPANDPDVCHHWQCNPASGQCEALVNLGKPCDDGYMCTKDTVCVADGSCGAGKFTCACLKDADCAGKNGGDLCLGTYYCDLAKGGTCLLNPATPVTCATGDDTACRKNTCAPKTGQCALVNLPDAVTCDADGLTCTVGDHCAAGACTPGAWNPACECLMDVDCAGKGNLCDGTYYCDKVQNICVLNPATPVTCPTVNNTACRVNTCDAKTGQCTLVDLPDSVTCDADGEACTVGDHCVTGTCTAGVKDPACECFSEADCAGKGDKCSGTYYCDLGAHVCVWNPATAVYCSPIADTACTKATCIPASGKCVAKQLPTGMPCDDLNACTAGGQCQNGTCVGQSICECIVDADCAGMPWADPCVGQVGCQWQGGIRKCIYLPGTAPTCAPASESCTTNVCKSATGKCEPMALADNSKCQGPDPCIVGQSCHGGSCQGGGNLCECANDNDCLQWEDGNLCNGLPYCDITTSYGIGATPHPCAVHKTLQVTCQPESGCSTYVCDPPTGICQLAATPCDDGEPCTSDACSGAACVHTPLTDKSPCVDKVLGGNGVCQSGVCLLP